MNPLELDGTKGIAAGAFAGCNGLTSISFPNSLTSIGDYAFDGCRGLTSIDIPNSVTTIGDLAFIDCSTLTDVTIPNSVNYMGREAFAMTAWIDNQPEGLVYTGPVVFAYKGLMPEGTSITIREGTKGICSTTFSDCTGLTSITIPSSVTTISGQAFYGCSGLTSVTIPSSVTTFGNEAFANCSGLTDVYCYISDLSRVLYGANQFHLLNGNYSSRKLHVPHGTADAYRIIGNWYYFGQIVDDLMPNVPSGDVNGDGSVNISDVTALIDYLLSGNPSGVNVTAADCNQDSSVNISDVTSLIDYLLSGTWN